MEWPRAQIIQKPRYDKRQKINTCLYRQLKRGRQSRSEVTLGPKLQRNRILILEFVHRGRLRRGRRQRRRSGKTLIEMKPHDFGRERQIFDRDPAGNHAELRNVEVRIAGVGDSQPRNGCAIGSAVGSLGRAVIANGRVAAEQAGRPLWIPIMGERTADTVGFRQLDRAMESPKLAE